jgi:hypothetical protein
MPAVAGGGLEAAVARAQAYEHGNDFARAIEAYLSLSPADTNNLDALQQCWEQVRLQSNARHYATTLLLCISWTFVLNLTNAAEQ